MTRPGKEMINNCKNKKIYVIGHHKPDADSIISAYILTNILKSMGIDAVFSVRDNNLCFGIDVQPWPCHLVAVLTSLTSSSVEWNNGS